MSRMDGADQRKRIPQDAGAGEESPQASSEPGRSAAPGASSPYQRVAPEVACSRVADTPGRAHLPSPSSAGIKLSVGAQRMAELGEKASSLHLPSRGPEYPSAAEIWGWTRMAIFTSASAMLEESMPPTDGIDSEPEGSRIGQQTLIFRREGSTWRVEYGGVGKNVQDAVGMRHLAHLLENPGREIHVIELRALAASENKPPPSGSAGALLDKRAIKDYKARLQEIEEELVEAEQNNDIGRVAKLKEEQQVLYSQVSRAVGLRGRRRRGSDDSERARQAVSAALHRAIKAIGKEHSELARHLTNCVRIGRVCSYEPDRPVSWTM